MKQPTLSEAGLLDLLAEVRASYPAPVSEDTSLSHCNGLMFHRAHLLALNPSQETKEERFHLDTCRRCAHLLASMKAAVENERQQTAPIVIRFPRPEAWAAATGEPLDERADLPDLAGEWRLVQENGSVLLRIRTREQAHEGALLRYQLRSAEGTKPLTGFVVLRAEETGWYTAGAAFTLEELCDTLNGECREVRFDMMEPGRLTGADRAPLAASVARSRDEGEQRVLRGLLERLPCAEGALGNDPTAQAPPAQ